MTDTQPSIIEQLIIDADRFGAVVATGGDWDGDSPCEGWTATSVVDHVIDTERDFFAQRGVDLGQPPQGAPADRWSTHWSAMQAVLTPELMAREFTGLLGDSTVGDVLSTFYGMDLVVHRWDLGRALGQQVGFTDEEISRVESILDQLGDNLYTYGASKPALPVSPDASREVALLARVGRAA